LTDTSWFQLLSGGVDNGVNPGVAVVVEGEYCDEVASVEVVD
jgi:hypothetical protein